MQEAPSSPGVYRYLDCDRTPLYVGKAKNLKRRLSNYRNATRKKAHRKMALLTREAYSLVYEVCESEQAALLRESELIRELAPTYNVDGAYAFLYPSLGLGNWDKHTLLCFTTQPERYASLELQWYGCFRSRPRVKAAYGALIDLLTLLGHREKASRLPDHPKLRGSRLVGLRQLPPLVVRSLPDFFAGVDRSLLGEVAKLLLTKPRALRDAAAVETNLKLLQQFYQSDAARLRSALSKVGATTHYVSQDERDALFIRATALR